MNKIKTLDYESKWGQSLELGVIVSSYRENNNLYVGLLLVSEDGVEPYTDLTRNLSKKLNPNEAFVKTFDENEGLLSFITDNKLGEILTEKGYSGYCEYHKIAFDMDKLAELDPSGAKTHLEAHCMTFPENNAIDDSIDNHAMEIQL